MGKNVGGEGGGRSSGGQETVVAGELYDVVVELVGLGGGAEQSHRRNAGVGGDAAFETLVMGRSPG